MKRRYLFGSAAFLILFSSQALLGGSGDEVAGSSVTGATSQLEATQADLVQSNLLSTPDSRNNEANVAGRELPNSLVIDRSRVTFGPAPDLANGGAPNRSSVAFRESISTPAHQLIAEISPKWARAAQVSEALGDTAAEEFALGMIQRLAEMSMEVGISNEDVTQLHLASHEHFEATLGGPRDILEPITSGDASDL